MPTYKLKKRITKAPLSPELRDSMRVAHSAITRIGYGLGRPKENPTAGEMVYDTPDPEDAEMIAQQVPQALSAFGIQGSARAEGRKLIVTVSKSLDKDYVDRGDDSKWYVEDEAGNRVAGPFNSYKEAEHVAGGLAPDWKAKGYGIKSVEPEEKFGLSYEPGTRVDIRQLGTGTVLESSLLGRTYKVQLDSGSVAEVDAARLHPSEKAWDKGYTAGATGKAKKVNPFKKVAVKPIEEEPEEEAEEEEEGGTEGNTAGDADSSSEVRSPTSTSTEAETQGNITVTGGAGEGATTTVTLEGKQGKKRAKLKSEWEDGWQRGQHDMSIAQQTKRLMGIV